MYVPDGYESDTANILLDIRAVLTEIRDALTQEPMNEREEGEFLLGQEVPD